jgi:DNA-binding NtrC family response regulator
VDDEHSMLRVGALLLRSRGYWVKAVLDGAFAWNALRVESFDLVITDHRMPRMTGVDLLRMMHTEGVCVPVILVTAAEPFDELKRQPAVQPTVMLLKPYTADEMLAAVERALVGPAAQSLRFDA